MQRRAERGCGTAGRVKVWDAAEPQCQTIHTVVAAGSWELETLHSSATVLPFDQRGSKVKDLVPSELRSKDPFVSSSLAQSLADLPVVGQDHRLPAKCRPIGGTNCCTEQDLPRLDRVHRSLEGGARGFQDCSELKPTQVIDLMVEETLASLN